MGGLRYIRFKQRSELSTYELIGVYCNSKLWKPYVHYLLRGSIVIKLPISKYCNILLGHWQRFGLSLATLESLDDLLTCLSMSLGSAVGDAISGEKVLDRKSDIDPCPLLLASPGSVLLLACMFIWSGFASRGVCLFKISFSIFSMSISVGSTLID